MVNTKKHLDSTQTRLGHKWVIEDVQAESEVNTESDPICSSAGCTQYKHKKTPLGYPINYPVPNNGVDSDIVDSHKSVAQAEADLGHDWVFGTKASKAKWHNVAKDTLYNFAPKLDGDMLTTSKNLADS